MIFFFSKKSLSRDDLTINSNSIIFNKFSIISIVSDFYLRVNFTFMLDKNMYYITLVKLYFYYRFKTNIAGTDIITQIHN